MSHCHGSSEHTLMSSSLSIGVSQENEQLRTALLKAQAEVSHIQTQLDKLKQEFMDQQVSAFNVSHSDLCVLGEVTGL